MTLEKNRQTEPLCKFGPGGDFVTVWQPDLSASRLTNRFTKLISLIAELLAIIIGFKRSSPSLLLNNSFHRNEYSLGTESR